MIGRDGWAGLAVLAFCAALWWLTLGIRGNPLVPISAAFYPRIVIGVTAFFAVLVVAGDVLARRGRGAAARAAQVRPNYLLVALSFAAFGIYVMLLPYLGFRVATFVYVAAAAAMLRRPRGGTDWLKVLVLAGVTTVVTYFVFERYLSVLLPRGRWTGF